MQIWTLTTFDVDSMMPLEAEIFTSEDAALASLDADLRRIWEEWEISDHDGEPLPYPDGNPWEAHAELCDHNGFPGYALGCHDVPSDPVRDAAPDMLAALEECEADMSRTACADQSKQTDHAARLGRVRAAIAKAKGGAA
jgi:hypothetical protein